MEESLLSTVSSSSGIYLYHTFPEAAKLTSKILLADRNKGELKSYLRTLPNPQAYALAQRVLPARRLLLKDIASFLEIKPGTLSEIRKKQQKT